MWFQIEVLIDLPKWYLNISLKVNFDYAPHTASTAISAFLLVSSMLMLIFYLELLQNDAIVMLQCMQYCMHRDVTIA